MSQHLPLLLTAQLGKSWVSAYGSRAMMYASSCVGQRERRTFWTQTRPV